MTEEKKYYFISDCHLGVPDYKTSLEREKKIVCFLDEIKYNAKALYLLGDIFDFWFEYKYMAPKGYIRLLGKLAELSDSGIEIHYFTGNHDLWVFSYFQKELNIKIHRNPIQLEFEGKFFFIGHGDGLGPGHTCYKIIKKVFTCRFFQRLFALIHPTLAFYIANSFSKKSRLSHNDKDCIYLGDDKESLVAYIKSVLQKKHFDYFIFGHRHLTLDMKIENSRYINLGEWLHESNYAVFDGKELLLKQYA